MLRMLARALFALVLATGVAAAADAPLTIGIPRPLSAETANADARALGGYLTSALKRPVEAQTFDTYDELAEALAQGKLDLAWITPLSYVKATRTARVFPIAKALRHGLSYRAVLFTRADAKASKLSELKGLKVAWVDPGSAAGYLFPRAMVLKDGQKPTGFFASEKFYGDHPAVCRAVLSGEADVGATFGNGTDDKSLTPNGCLESLGKAETEKLRGIVGSDRIPNEVIAARAGFDEGIAAQLARIFALLSETESGKRILTSIFRADGFGLALEQDFEPVRMALDAVESGRWPEPMKTVKAAPAAPQAEPAKAPAKQQKSKGK